MVFTQANTIYILKSSLTPQSERKDVDKGSTSANVSTTPSCFNRKTKNTNKNSNKTNKNQHLTVHVCCVQLLIFLICREIYEN